MDVAYYKDISDIPDTLLIKSGTVIAEYHNNDINLSLEVCGSIKIWYGEDYYTDPEEYPEALTDMLMHGLYNEESISNNNWYELFELDDKGDKTGKSWVVNCDNYTEKDIREMFEEAEDEIKRERIRIMKREKETMDGEILEKDAVMEEEPDHDI